MLLFCGLLVLESEHFVLIIILGKTTQKALKTLGHILQSLGYIDQLLI